MIKKTLATSMIFSVLLFMAAAVYAGKEPRPLAHDGRIKQVLYDPNQVVDIVGTYGYVTMIEFAQGEIVKEKKLGDSIAWQTLIKDRFLYIKPVEPDATGNMVVITNKRTYFFKLKSSNTDMTYLVRFKYPAGSEINSPDSHGLDKLSRGFNAEAINMNYASTGKTSAIQLKHVFDDGEFTYFQFDQQADIPSFYLVESDGTESIVNSRREGSYMVVERTGHMFTLRNGDAHLCVENINLKKGNV